MSLATTRTQVGHPLTAPITLLLGLSLFVAAAIVSRVSPLALIVVGIAFIGLVAYAGTAWPRAAIVVVVLSPLLDRYLVAGLFPRDLQNLTHFVSEGLLLAVTVSLVVAAGRDGRLMPAIRHPLTPLMAAFVLIGVISAALNGVPIQALGLGLLLTLDAVVLFFLPRLVPWSSRQAAMAVGALFAVVVAAALVVVAQALLSPRILGLDAVPGRFGEVYRLAGFIGDPNVYGTFIVIAAPFSLLAAMHVPSRRLRRIAIALSFLLVVTLWLSFSRGAWLAMVVSGIVVFALIDRRVLLLAAAIIGLSFVTAIFMPRDLLVARGPGGGGAEQPVERPNVFDSTFDRFGTIGAGRDLRTLFVLNALPIIGDHPVLGVGPGRYGGAAADLLGTPIYAQYGTDELFTVRTQRTVDNFWLHLLVEVGVVGAAAFVAAALMPGIRILQAARGSHGWSRILLGGIATATVGIAVASLSTMLLEANSVAFPFWFLLGLGSVLVAAASDRDGAVARASGEERAHL